MQPVKTPASLTLSKAPNSLRAWLPAFLSYWLPPLLLTGGIFFMAGDYGSTSRFHWPTYVLRFLLPSLSPREILQLVGLLRKILHFLVYASLFSVYARAFRWQLHLGRWPLVILTLSVCLLISGADEGRQAFYPSRSGRVTDVLLDMSGALTAAAVLWPWLRPKEP